MLATTKQFRKAIRMVLRKHNIKKLYTLKIHSVNTFGTSGDYRMFSTFGKRKVSFNLLVDSKEQWKAIVKDCRALWKDTWQSNLMKYTWYGNKGSKTVEMNASDERLLSNCRIEGTCIYNDMTQEQWQKHIDKKLKDIVWGEAMTTWNNNKHWLEK